VVTAAQVFEMIKAVVEAHPTFNTFYDVWAPAKERPSEMTYPCVVEEGYGARGTEDTNGLVYRSQLVRLLVITTVATDRTAQERRQAIHAADNAAFELVASLRSAYANFIEVSNVIITTQWDENTTLETGVLLQFTVTSLGAMCEDAAPGQLPTFPSARLALDDLIDVDATNPDDGAIILFDADSSRWILGTISGGGGASLDTTTTPGYITIPNALGAGVTGYVPILDSAP
jgi:hypothetical protein